MDRMPVLDLQNTNKLKWLQPHTALQLSDRERAISNGDAATKATSSNVLVNVKETIHALMMYCSGVDGEKTRAISLSEPSNRGIYTILLIGGIRLDLASLTVVLDTAIIPLSDERMPGLAQGIRKLQNASPVLQLVTIGHEVAAWKQLLPAYAERCRTWLHKANCEYASHGAVPIGVKIDQNPICTCGEGVGFTSPEWNVPSWKDLLPFATRAAISPLFSVSYIERTTGKLQSLRSPASQSSGGGSAANEKSSNACWLCGSSGNPTLLVCGKCKKARYCSAACQRQDWKEHKKGCKAG
jgi:hypothetical protein